MHALVGGLLSQAGGGSFATGALAAGANEALVTTLSKAVNNNPGLLLVASQLVGIAAASATGGDVQKGADIAKSARAYNYLNHHEVDDLVKDLKGCRSAADPKLCRTDIAAQYKTISDKTTNSKLGGCAGETGCFEQLEVVDGATKALDQYASDKDLGPEEKNIIQDFQESNFHDYVIARNIWLSGFLKEVTPIILSGGAGAVTKAEGTAGKTAAAETELGGGAKGIVNATSHKADDIRFSQNTVTFNKTDKEGAFTYSDLVKSMKSDGWKGDPVDVVRMPDGKLTSIDNTRIAAAREAGIDVKATVR